MDIGLILGVLAGVAFLVVLVPLIHFGSKALYDPSRAVRR